MIYRANSFILRYRLAKEFNWQPSEIERLSETDATVYLYINDIVNKYLVQKQGR